LHRSLRAYLSALRAAGDLVEVEAEVDPRLEIAEIHRRVVAEGGPALLFRRPRGSAFPVATNLFGTRARVERAFGPRPFELVREIASAARDLLPPTAGRLWAHRRLLFDTLRVGTKSVRSAPVLEVREAPRLSALPVLTSAPEDGGPFVTLPLVYTEHPDPRAGSGNLGIYRLQVFDDRTTGFHVQIGKGAGFHLHEAEARGAALPVTVFLGGPPALTLAAVAPLPEGAPELLLASLLRGSKLEMANVRGGGHRLVAEAEFALRGRVPPRVRRPEGPFGDHYGYYSLRHDYPVLEIEEVCRRRDAIYPATVVGKPRQEDFHLGEWLQELLSPLFPLVMPSVVDLWSYGDAGFHSLAAAVVRDRYPREALVSAFRILGEGQLSLTKFLLLTDGRVDLRDFRATLEHVLARARFESDLFVFSCTSMDTLDYTGPRVNEGSKGLLAGLGAPVRELPRKLVDWPRGVKVTAVFCPGCVVVSGPSYAEDREFASRLARDPTLERWPLAVLVDDAVATAASPEAFLWRVFTRFEPAADLHAAEAVLVRHKPAYGAPIVIDARTKPGYPGEVEPDPETAKLVSRRWREYFPTSR